MKGKLAALALATTVTQAQAAIPEGTYSNVCISTETSDLSGVELQVGHASGKPALLIWNCEGGCGQALPVSKISTRDDQISFTAADQTYHSSGTLAQTTLWRFTVTLRGRAVVLESPTFDPKRQILQKQIRKTPAGNPKALPTPTRRCGQ